MTTDFIKTAKEVLSQTNYLSSLIIWACKHSLAPASPALTGPQCGLWCLPHLLLLLSASDST